MVVEILVRAVTCNTGNRVKGYPVAVKPQGHPWGALERLPNYIHVRVMDAASIGQVKNYVTPWRRRTTYEILRHDVQVDNFQVRVFADPLSIGNRSLDLTADEMRQFLVSWGAQGIQDAQAGVMFEITAMDALNAKAYLSWGKEDEFVNFTEINYDVGTGVHKVSMDYALSNLKNRKEIELPLLRAACKIISHDIEKAVLVFEASREIMIKCLEQQVSNMFDIMLGRATYSFSEAFVDNVVTVGGTTDLIFSKLQSEIQDVRI